MNLEALLQSLYDSEIDVMIKWTWDGGFEVALLTYVEDAVVVREAAEIAPTLHSLALQKYPESVYAKSFLRAS